MQKEAYDGRRLALYHDCYTGKLLHEGDRYDYEHFISAEEAFMQLRTTHTNDQIAVQVNHPDNVAVTLRTITQYKGKYNLIPRLLENSAKVEEFEIDVILATNNYKIAHRAVFG